MLSSTVLEIIVQKLLQPRTRKEKYEDRAKQGLVFLHQALSDYHKAYKRYSEKSEDLSYNECIRAINWLDHVWNVNEPVIAVFDPQLHQYVENYLAGTASVKRQPMKQGEIPGQMLMSAMIEEQKTSDEDFECAITRLREFMKETMTMGEIRRARQIYRMDRFWWRSRL